MQTVGNQSRPTDDNLQQTSDERCREGCDYQARPLILAQVVAE